MSKPVPTSDLNSLAKAHQYLIGSFAIAFVMNFVKRFIQIKYMNVDPPIFIEQALPFIEIAHLIGSILVMVSIYIGARRLGFNKLTTIVSVILALFIGLLGLILVISADLRITKHLRKQGWKVGLFGAKPNQSTT